MKLNFLFPSKFKRIGWFTLIPSAIIGLSTLIYEYEPSFLDFNVPAIFVDELFSVNKKTFRMVTNNILNEILGVLIIISTFFVAFSKEKSEDEYISKIRFDSLAWAVYFNYAILILTILFIYDFAFLWVMVFNMFTVLLFFIVRFNWQISKLKKSARYEE
jgi:FlaA1/EpsC-like NDP-sugar epimerase